MRFNRGTIGLLAILLVVIVVVLVVNNQQANAPGEATPTTAAPTGALLPNVAAENIVRFDIRDNLAGGFTAITKDAGGSWVIDSTNALADRVPEQSLIDTTAGQIVAINYSNMFTESSLANFGLDSPDYTITVTTSDGQLYTIYVGDKQPTGPRYYAVVEQGAAPATTPDAASTAEAASEVSAEATAEVTENPSVTLEGEQTVYLIPQTVIDTLKRWIASPPYAPLPTATPTLAPTATPEVTAEATPEATAAS